MFILATGRVFLFFLKFLSIIFSIELYKFFQVPEYSYWLHVFFLWHFTLKPWFYLFHGLIILSHWKTEMLFPFLIIFIRISEAFFTFSMSISYEKVINKISQSKQAKKGEKAKGKANVISAVFETHRRWEERQTCSWEETKIP